MSADGIINDYTKPIKIHIFCYHCRRQLDPKDPTRNHDISASACSSYSEGYGERALKISVQEDNIEL